MRFFAVQIVLGIVCRAQSELDGCQAEIPKSAIIYRSGSAGYSVDCSAVAPTPTTAFTFKGSGRRMFASLLQTEGAADQSSSLCFSGPGTNEGLTTAASATLKLNGVHVIRGVKIDEIANNKKPSSVRLGSRDTENSPLEYYVSNSDEASSASWSNLPLGNTVSFEKDVAGEFVQLFPAIPPEATSANGYGFAVTFTGCQASLTASVSFEFETSKTAIVRQFKTVSAFTDKLSEFICNMVGFTSRPDKCARVLFAGIREFSKQNPVAGQLAPTSIPMIEVFFRILPPSSSCVACDSAGTVQVKLQDALKDPKSTQSLTIHALATWIQDADPYTCYNKICDDGSLCFNGACIATSNLQSQSAAQLAIVSTLTTGTNIDSILTLQPLNVISTADQISGVLTFSKTPAPPGQLPNNNNNIKNGPVGGTVTTQTPVTTNDQTFLQRFLIPISVAGGVALVIVGLIGFKMYKRSQLAAEQLERQV